MLSDPTFKIHGLICSFFLFRFIDIKESSVFLPALVLDSKNFKIKTTWAGNGNPYWPKNLNIMSIDLNILNVFGSKITKIVILTLTKTFTNSIKIKKFNHCSAIPNLLCKKSKYPNWSMRNGIFFSSNVYLESRPCIQWAIIKIHLIVDSVIQTYV